MDTFSAIKERRSVKNYDPEHCMSDAEIHQPMEVTLLSPTSSICRTGDSSLLTIQSRKQLFVPQLGIKLSSPMRLFP